MLTKLIIHNFKLFNEVELELGDRVVLIGPNNAGKTTALQALALWDIGLKRWMEKRGAGEVPAKRPGVTINRRDLIAVPVPAANLLWHDLHVRSGRRENGKTRTENVLVEIVVDGIDWSCGLEFDYANEESFYCRPLRLTGDKRMAVPDKAANVRIAYLPPMSGLAANETRLDPGAINVRLGEGRTAEVLRNLCYQIVDGEDGESKWRQIAERIGSLFGSTLDRPQYIAERGEITMTYRAREGVQLDLSASGRGQQQTLLLLAHMTANPNSVLLLDEPDAHLEILRQRQIYQLLSETAERTGSQIIAASHSEVVLNEAADRDVLIAFVGKPHRIDDRGSQVTKALKEIGFEHYLQAEEKGWILYLEGSTDLAILLQLARRLDHPAAELLENPYVHYVANQPRKAQEHFYGVREAKPDLMGLALYDRLEQALPKDPNLVQHMWRKRELENYLCRRKVLLDFAEAEGRRHAGELFGSAWRQHMDGSIVEIELALKTLEEPSPWGPDIKASDAFLDRLFKRFYDKLQLPNLMTKTDYHRLAGYLSQEDIDAEIAEQLDALVAVAQSASTQRGMTLQARKKLIEVALPLDAINKASAREKSIRHGHPSTLHLWWARRPLAAARAVIFAQMVDDPSGYVDVLLSDSKKKRAAERELKKRLAEHAAKQALADDDAIAEPEPTLEEVIADIERDRLFAILEDLVLWENTTNETVLQRARDEIWQSWRRACAENADHPRAKELFDRNKLPGFHDPFAGGGALPLEAQRLGLESYASDLNPVAVLINKAMIEVPPKFAGKPPVNPESRKGKNLFAREWKGAQGLAEDIRYYGQWMRDEAEKRIGHLYPKVEVTSEMAKERPDLKPYVGRRLTVIAWLWARTVKSPNPAFANVDVPLASTFMLSTKAGKEAYVEPIIEDGGYRFTVQVGKPKDAAAAKAGTKLSRGANFQCLMSGTPMDGDFIKAEGKAGRMGARLMAIVADGDRGRVYFAPTPEHEAVARKAKPEWKPEGAFVEDARAFTPCIYGIKEWQDLFTDRQLVALTTFSDLVQQGGERVQRDALAAGFLDNSKPLRDGGAGATAYAEAVSVYLTFALSKQADLGNSLCRWEPIAQCPRQVFGRQALPMLWDYAEGNPLGNSSGAWSVFVDGIVKAFAKAFERVPSNAVGRALQADASTQDVSRDKLVSTDPPYYDNVPYADLSDFFYVWMRRSLKPIFPDLFATLEVPKTEELVAFGYRHDGKAGAEAFFLRGMTQAMHRLAEQAHPAFPVTIYYAFKQAESKAGEGTASTGWETFLDAVIRAGFATSGTWPIRTENESRMRGQTSNALASSIVLVCRQRDASAPTATRRQFVTALKAELPEALAHLQRGNIAPVDLAQAAIGPGMAVYTRYEKVLDAEGKPLPIREALALINQTLDEALAEQEGDFDADSRWALTWFEQSGFAEGEYGVAEQLSKAKNTSVAGLEQSGILASKGGRVRLLKPDELPVDWDPATDTRLTSWEMVHHLIRVLETHGESAAAELAARLGAKAEAARELCYRLYTLCERKKRAAEALSYNALVQSWPEIARLARERAAYSLEPTQTELL